MTETSVYERAFLAEAISEYHDQQSGQMEGL